jgi:ribosome biogenesis GTPase
MDKESELNLLESLGWDAAWASALRPIDMPDLAPARVCAEHRGAYTVLGALGERRATAAGRLRHEAHHGDGMPAVGDWAACSFHGDQARIHHLLPRRTALVRKVAAEKVVAPQVVAANVDTVFLATSLNHDWNPRRLERTLALVYESGARPVVVLTKSDLCDDPEAFVREAEAVALGVAVHALSPLTGAGLEALDPYLGPGRTVAVLGSSGVGKSTLANRLLGEERLEVRSIRADDDRGCHTTTARQLLPLPRGGALIDTPGLRGVALWDAGEGLEQAFGDIAELAARCRFRDCAHDREPGCAVRAAVARGDLERERFEAWGKLRRELAFQESKGNLRAQAETKRKWKALSKEIRRWKET